MGVSLSTARWLAPASFVYDFGIQQWALNSSPNMMDVHKQNISFWSPNPYFIGAFFFPQQFFQLAWMYKLIKSNPATASASEKRHIDGMRRYAPYFALGNVCIGTWAFFWNSSNLKSSNVFVLINSFSQLWYMFTQLEPMDTSSWTSILTHVVSKSIAGIGALDFVHNTSVAYFKNVPPPIWVKAATGVGFMGLSAFSDWIFGGCLVYDLIGLAVGQADYNGKEWATLLGAYAVGSAAIIASRNMIRPPYNKGETAYVQAAQDEVDDRV